MPKITVGRENNTDIEIYYEDHGAGQPVVLIHGYPLSGRAWDKQVPVLLEAGYRVITYDRRGFGQSSQPVTGYDYDTFAADLAALLDHLDLHDAVLVGHSMGTGEVTRYLGTHGSARVAKGVLVSPIPPFLLQTADNVEGVPQGLFDGFVQAAAADAPAWMKGFLDNFYNFDTLRGTLVSDQAWQASWNLAVTASATAAVACIGTWTTDFRADLPEIDVPVLVIQGDADQVLPLDKTGKRLPGLRCRRAARAGGRVPFFLDAGVAPALVEVAHERRSVGGREHRAVAADHHVARGVARVLREFLRRRAPHDAAAHAARKAHPLALDVRARLLPDLERLRIVAEIDADLFKDRVGVVLEEFESLAPQHFVIRDLAGDVRYESVAACGARRDLGITAAGTAGSPGMTWLLLLVHRGVLRGSTPLWSCVTAGTDRFAA